MASRAHFKYSDKNFQFNDQLSKIVEKMKRKKTTHATNIKLVAIERQTDAMKWCIYLKEEKIAAINTFSLKYIYIFNFLINESEFKIQQFQI